MDELYRFVELRPAQVGRIDGRNLVPTWSDPWTALHAELVGILNDGGDIRARAREFLEDEAATAAVQPLLRLHRRAMYVSPLPVSRFTEWARQEIDGAEALNESRRTAGDVMIAVPLLPEIAALPRDTAHELVVLGAVAQRLAFADDMRGQNGLEGDDQAGDEDVREDVDVQVLLSSSAAVLPSELFQTQTGGSVFAIRGAADAAEVEREARDLLVGGPALLVAGLGELAGDGEAPAIPQSEPDDEEQRRVALRELAALVRDPEFESEAVEAVGAPDDETTLRLRPVYADSLPRPRLVLNDRARARLSESTQE